MGKIVSGFIVFFVFSSVTGLGQSYKEQIYDSYIKGDMNKWEVVMGEMKDLWEGTKNYDLLFDYTIAQYGYTAFCLARDQKDIARDVVEDAVDNAKLMIKRVPGKARVHALLGALYGFKVGLNPLKVFAYTNRSSDEIKLAHTLDPNDSHVWMEKGNFELYKPSIFGGDKKEAIKHFKKSTELFESNKSELEYNWLYLNTLNGLAKAYIKTGNFRKADLTYKKILRVEPNMTWIRDKDYPKFLEKYGNVIQ